MTIPVPPSTPPVVITTPVQQQNQNQNQNQDNTTNIGKLNQNQSTKSDADSSADSSSSQSSSLQNIQVNNNSNRLEYNSFKIPETTLNLNFVGSKYGDSNSEYQVVLGLNVPLGGASRKLVKSALDTQVKSDLLAFEQTYASVCANVDKENYNIINHSGSLLLLKNCKSDIVPRTSPPISPPLVVPPTNLELDQLRKDNAELRLMLSQLAAKLDVPSVVPAGF